MVASYTAAGDSCRSERPVPWSDVHVSLLGFDANSFDLHPGGDRIALRPGDVAPDSVVVVFNFFDELRRLTAEGGVAKP